MSPGTSVETIQKGVAAVDVRLAVDTRTRMVPLGASAWPPSHHQQSDSGQTCSSIVGAACQLEARGDALDCWTTLVYLAGALLRDGPRAPCVRLAYPSKQAGSWPASDGQWEDRGDAAQIVGRSYLALAPARNVYVFPTRDHSRHTATRNWPEVLANLVVATLSSSCSH